jgi:hypothetical protein
LPGYHLAGAGNVPQLSSLKRSDSRIQVGDFPADAQKPVNIKEQATPGFRQSKRAYGSDHACEFRACSALGVAAVALMLPSLESWEARPPFQ